MGNRVLSCIYSPLANRQAPQLFQPICLVKTSRTITTAINITMLFSKTAVLARGLAILPLTLAYDCTNTNAFDWPKPSSGGSGSGGSCSETCGNDLSCVQQCLELEIMGGCAAIELTGGVCVEKMKRGVAGVKRDTLECTTRESCYLFTDGSLVCMDFVTGDYHDDSGNSGNAISGDYTEVSGSATTALDESSTFLAQETGSSASGVRDTSTTSTSAEETEGATQTSRTVASVTSTGAAERLHVGAVFAGLGLVARLIL